MPLKNTDYLEVPEKKPSGKQSKLKEVINELVTSVKELKEHKGDVSNLKASYKEYASETNASIGTLNAKIEALELLVKTLVEKLDEIENIEI